MAISFEYSTEIAEMKCIEFLIIRKYFSDIQTLLDIRSYIRDPQKVKSTNLKKNVENMLLLF